MHPRDNLSIPFLAFGLACAFACGGTDDSGKSTSSTVTGSGGSVALEDGSAILTVPPGAVAKDTEIGIRVVPGSGVSDLATELYELSPSGIVFQVPVKFVIRVGTGVATDGIFLGKVVDGAAVPVAGSKFDASSRILSANLGSFSQYGGFVPAASFADCQSCVQAKCPDELNACENAAACQDILGCIENCVQDGGNSDACTDTCRQASPGGVALFETMASCGSSKCDVCGGNQTASTCDECVTGRCPEPLSACEAQAACNASIQCIEGCAADSGNYEACVNGCMQANPGSEALMDTLGDCIDEHCKALCSGDDPKPSDLPSISFQGTLYVHPSDSIDGANTVWGLEGNPTGATSASGGAANTAAIVGALGGIGTDYAAKVCADLDSKGFDDWYLPARDELNALYDQQATLPGFEPLWYWSSTEEDKDKAFIQNFADGFAHAISKGLLGRVRCVRRN